MHMVEISTEEAASAVVVLAPTNDQGVKDVADSIKMVAAQATDLEDAVVP